MKDNLVQGTPDVAAVTLSSGLTIIGTLGTDGSAAVLFDPLFVGLNTVADRIHFWELTPFSAEPLRSVSISGLQTIGAPYSVDDTIKANYLQAVKSRNAEKVDLPPGAVSAKPDTSGAFVKQ